MGGLFNEVLGAEVEVPEVPNRIVSFSPAATEALFEVGAGDRVVGVSAFCARPPEASTKKKVGSYNTVRDGLLEGLDPDLILTVTGYQRQFALRLSRKYPVYPLELPLSTAGVVDFVVKVGLVAGEPERARELERELLERVGRVRRAPRMKVYAELDLGGPVAFGAYSYITDSIRLLGCSSVTEREKNEWLTPDFVEVAREDPDVIIYEPKMFTEFRSAELERLVSSRGWEGVRAVREGNCFVTPGPLDFLAHHGPSFVREAVPWLEATLWNAAENLGVE